jgi:transcriptional regulator with XRE-family HTH domain
MSTIFGDKIRMLREGKQIPQRQIAAVLKIDTATYCKIEKGERRAKRAQVTVLADMLEYDSIGLLRLWSADKVYEIIAEEEGATQILHLVEDSILEYKQKTTKI